MEEEISRIITKIIFSIIFLSIFVSLRKKEYSLYSFGKDCYENLEAARKGSILNIFVVIMIFGSTLSLLGIILYSISNSTIVTLISIIVVLYLSIKIIYHNEEIYEKDNLLTQKQNQLIQQRYQKIQIKWEKRQKDNYSEALKVYPSKHLLNNENEWTKMLEKQADYTEKKNEIYAKELQKEYNLTKEEWKEIKSQYLIESFKISKENVKNN